MIAPIFTEGQFFPGLPSLAITTSFTSTFNSGGSPTLIGPGSPVTLPRKVFTTLEPYPHGVTILAFNPMQDN